METLLLPNPRLPWRIAGFAVMVAIALISTVSWPSKIGFILWMAFFLGSFRIARIREDRFERRMVLMFVPLPLKSWPLKQFLHIETKTEAGPGVGTLVVIGFAWWIVWYVLDWLVPWMGGNLKLRLRPPKGPRVVVWQGNSLDNFEENLRILHGATGLGVERR